MVLDVRTSEEQEGSIMKQVKARWAAALHLRWAGGIAAAFAATISTLALTTVPAQAAPAGPVATCNSARNHCYIGYQYINPTYYAGDSEGWFLPNRYNNNWSIRIYNENNQDEVPWIDVIVKDTGATIRYKGVKNNGTTDGGYKDYDDRGFAVSKWRLCDPFAGRCTAFVTPPAG
ncbi:hypothetical protein [Actinoplanes aureus]|uniref:Uncharacterized protein n=1 Tax=Actinoplanes aureus TaxID=2792083 RepID=A0A931G162_9ACTN|nr:hypothetical protein [Actinoplanes aureus]MBG0567538.1 hypothetical protein [Actinoplanes aureus]